MHIGGLKHGQIVTIYKKKLFGLKCLSSDQPVSYLDIKGQRETKLTAPTFLMSAHYVYSVRAPPYQSFHHNPSQMSHISR